MVHRLSAFASLAQAHTTRRTAVRLGAGSLAIALSARRLGFVAAQVPTPAATPTTPGQTVRLNGADIYYVVYGSGTPVVLLHPAFAHGGVFYNQIPALVDAGYQAIVIDSRGQGHSSHGPQPLSYELMASDVLGVLDHVGLAKVDLVGWSSGAIIGLELGIHHPDRFTKIVAYGANYNPAGFHDATPTPERDAFFNAFFAQLTADYQQFAPDPHEMDVLGQELPALDTKEPNFSDAALRSIPIPVLILDGKLEEYIPADQPVHLAALIPDATLVIMPDVGHFAPIQKPDEFNQIILAYLAA